MKKRAKIIATRVADRNNVVHSIEGGGDDYCRQPCEECPWKVANTGSFPAEAFRLSAGTAHDMATHTFACHMRGAVNPATCAGFILNGGMDNLIVRLKRGQGAMLDVTHGGHRLHKSYRSMAVANGVPKNDPTLALCMPEARFKNTRPK